MSKNVYNAAAACNLRHPPKAVLKELAWFADDDGQEIWPSVELLAARTGLSRRAIQQQLRRGWSHPSDWVQARRTGENDAVLH